MNFSNNELFGTFSCISIFFSCLSVSLSLYIYFLKSSYLSIYLSNYLSNVYLVDKCICAYLCVCKCALQTSKQGVGSLSFHIVRGQKGKYVVSFQLPLTGFYRCLSYLPPPPHVLLYSLFQAMRIFDGVTYNCFFSFHFVSSNSFIALANLGLASLFPSGSFADTCVLFPKSAKSKTEQGGNKKNLVLSWFLLSILPINNWSGIPKHLKNFMRVQMK